MCVYSDVVIPPEEFVLSRPLRAHPDLRIELERAVLVGTEPSPYLWVANACGASIEATIESDPAIDHVESVDPVEDELLVRVRWRDRDGGFLRTLVDTSATCLKCVGTHDAWHLSLRFRSSSGLAEWYHRCTNDDRRIVIQNIRTGANSPERHQSSNLSTPQREAIYTALERGYFSVPRKITLQELADALGVSDTAASQRLRRGLEVLLTDVLPGGESVLSTANPQ